MSVIVASKAAQAAGQGIQIASGVSKELLGYDFVGLLIKLGIYYLVALVIAKFLEAVVGGQNFIITLARLFGVQLPATIPQWLADFYTTGYMGVKYWDFVKGLSILLVVLEADQYYKNQKRLGGEPSYLTLGIFGLIGSLLALVTVPELLQRIKESALLKEGTIGGEPSV